MAFQIQLLRLSFIIFFLSGVYSVNFRIKNNCKFPIWPGALTGAGSQVSSTGFKLVNGSTATVSVSSPWSGRFWARTHCSTDTSSGKFSCESGDCGSGEVSCNGNGAIPPASLVEFTIATNEGKDFFDISLVDGFNLPVSVTPSDEECKAVVCEGNVNAVCPPELAVKGKNEAVTIGCKSACMAFNKPEYCCSGDHNLPQTCPPTNYSKIFKAECPQAYSYAYDDKTSTFTCSGRANYDITFCPSSSRY